MPASFRRVVTGGLLLLLGFSVFAFGGTSYWARAVLAAGAAVLFLLWWTGETRSEVPAAFHPAGLKRSLDLGGVKLARSGFGVLAGLFVVAVLLSLVPVPDELRALLAPGLAARQVPAAEVLGLEAAAGAASWRPLSVDPSGTLDALLLFAAYGLLFVVAYNLIDSRERLVRMARGLVLLAFLVALVGLVQELAGAEKIYGLKVLRWGGSPFGPFVNHNHFAGYMEMTIPLAFALFLRRLRRPPERGPVPAPGEPSGPGSTARRMLGEAGPQGERFGQATLLALALTVMLAALLLCLSRGGLLALATASAAVLLLLALGRHLARWEVAALVGVSVLGLGLFLWVGPGEALTHFRKAESLQNEPSLAVRPLVWAGTLDAFRESPVLGAGLGTFPTVFLHHYPSGTERLWYQAHNDYVQLLAETGVLGGLLALAALIVLLRRLLGPLLARARIPERYVFCGLVTAIVSILVHSIVDFNLQVPANAAQFAVLCAMAMAHRRVFGNRKEA